MYSNNRNVYWFNIMWRPTAFQVERWFKFNGLPHVQPVAWNFSLASFNLKRHLPTSAEEGIVWYMVVVIWVLLSFEMLLLIVLIITSTQIHVHYNWDQLNARNFFWQAFWFGYNTQKHFLTTWGALIIRWRTMFSLFITAASNLYQWCLRNSLK